MSDPRSVRPAYEAPKLTRHGSFSDLTLGSLVGANLDHTFPTGFPGSLLTFS